jgi:hypothetical protein
LKRPLARGHKARLDDLAVGKPEYAIRRNARDMTARLIDQDENVTVTRSGLNALELPFSKVVPEMRSKNDGVASRAR